MAAFLVLFLFLLFWNIGMLMAASCDERTSIVVASKKMNRFGRRWTMIEEDEQRLHVYVFVFFLKSAPLNWLFSTCHNLNKELEKQEHKQLEVILTYKRSTSSSQIIGDDFSITIS
jgi:hypothetical protein